ncbi:hypothetical protein VTI28DRAFT_3801 [Corynascus sepedonium]
MSASHANSALDLDPDSLGSHTPMFKKHKVLPHPRKDDLQRSSPLRRGRKIETSLPRNSASPAASPSGLQRVSRQSRGPEPPPTPPAHSRTSSASHTAGPSTPKLAGNALGSTDSVEPRPLATPNQQTPPTPNLTPDRTPPGPAASQALRRPRLNVRNSSRVTTDSRDDSFTTAREDPYSTDEDDGRSTLRPSLPSAKTSQSTVRQVSGGPRNASQPVGLGLGIEPSVTDDDSKPRAAQEFMKFDGDWTNRRTGGSNAGIEREWDPNSMKNVTVRKRQPTRPKESRNQEIVDDRAVTPTNATRALRSMSLEESPIVYPSRRTASDRYPTRTAPAHSQSSSSVDVKRSSVISTKSNASTKVEAMVVEPAPQRRKTLRHVRKQSALRDSGSEMSPASSAPTSVSPAADGRRQLHGSTAPKGETVRESYASTATNTSISSRKARRSVWNSGGVPVVVIPERRSSVKSNGKSPSLRSTSSRRTWSLSSVPVSQPSRSKEHVPIFERPTRRSRAFSESDGSRAGDQRTMDFPPVIPTRSSSLSAPTSRNASRTGSLTAESLQTHNVFQAQQAHRALQQASSRLDKLRNSPHPADNDDRQSRAGVDRSSITARPERRQPVVLVEHAAQDKQSELGGSRALTYPDPYSTPRMNGEPGVERDEDAFFGKRLSVQNTPLSVASAETTATSQAEVSEALAVNIYPHQSKSVVLVNHSAKPSESSSLEQNKSNSPGLPAAETSPAMRDNPSTPPPPPPQLSVNDVDSPLRNPRAPPQPPAINFIPATPSGLTPTCEKQKQLGNYYEVTAEKPKRSVSLLKRALTRRTAASDYGPSPVRPVGLLTRTLSLSRNIRRRDERPRFRRRSTADSLPPDETRLHPHWRPAYVQDEPCDCCSCCDGDEVDYDANDHRDGGRNSRDDNYDDDDEHDRTYRYPPIDNRPSPPYPPSSSFTRRAAAPPRRRLSERLKRTFAILPLESDRHHYDGGFGEYDDKYYPATAHDAPDRRTIRRTPSGNLRVMKFRQSMESLTGHRGAAVMPPAVVIPAAAGDRSQHWRGRTLERRYTRLWRSLSLRARASIRRRRSFNHSGVGGGYGYAADATALGADDRRDARVGDDGGYGDGGKNVGGTTGFLPTLSDRINLPRRLSERRREKRTQELRGMISSPREVRDGVGDVIRRNSWRDRDALYVLEQQRERRRMQQQEGEYQI